MSLHTKFYSLALLFIYAAGTLAVEDAPAPLSPEEAVQEMRLPEGFAATLVAAEPNVVQPISFCFDDRGRLFVAEALNYGEWQPTGKDRIVILEDTNADGRFDNVSRGRMHDVTCPQCGEDFAINLDEITTT